MHNSYRRSGRIVGKPEPEIGLVANFRVARFSSKWIASERSLLPLLAKASLLAGELGGNSLLAILTPCRAAQNVTVLVPFSCRLCARLWRERNKRLSMKRTIVVSANPRPNVFESHGFENSSYDRGLLRRL